MLACDAMQGFNVRRLSARSNRGSKERALQGKGVVIVMCECAPIVLLSIRLTRGREPFGGLACVATQGILGFYLVGFRSSPQRGFSMGRSQCTIQIRNYGLTMRVSVCF